MDLASIISLLSTILSPVRYDSDSISLPFPKHQYFHSQQKVIHHQNFHSDTIIFSIATPSKLP